MNTKDLIDLIYESKLSECDNLLKSILKEKILLALEAKKIFVFNPDRPGDIIKGLKRDDAIRLVQAYGYKFNRHGGEHDVYTNPEHPDIKHKSIEIPRHKGELHNFVTRKIQNALKTLKPVTEEEIIEEKEDDYKLVTTYSGKDKSAKVFKTPDHKKYKSTFYHKNRIIKDMTTEHGDDEEGAHDLAKFWTKL